MKQYDALLLLLFLLSACTTPKPSTTPKTVNIKAPTTAIAGKPIPITVEPVADQSLISLLVSFSNGPQILQVASSAGRASFLIPGEWTRAAGVLWLEVASYQGSATIQILPGAPDGLIQLIVGPHNLPAGSEESSMATIIPMDQYGNRVSDGTPIEVTLRHPDGSIQKEQRITQGGVAYLNISSGTQIGRIFIAAQSGTAHSREADLNIVAGPVAAITISANPKSLTADGRQLMTLRTAPLRDLYGHLIADATLVLFIVQGPNGDQRRLPAMSIDGIAETQLQAPAQPGSATITAQINQTLSQPIQVNFTSGAVAGTIPIEFQIDQATSTLIVRAGPLVGALGQLSSDGTNIGITLIDAARKRHEYKAVSLRGYAEVTIPKAQIAPGSGRIEVQVGTGYGELAYQIP